MTVIKKICLLFYVSAWGILATAQDIHYSQYFKSPLLFNPALTGSTTGLYRVGVNYRNQWFTAAGAKLSEIPYMTTTLYADVPVRIKNDVLGAGLYIANDLAGGNLLSATTFCASVSYMKSLGKKQNHYLSAGFQAGYTTQTLKIAELQFASQFQGNAFNGNLSTNENIGTNRLGYLNLNTGLFWYGKFNDVLGIYAGGAFFNISTPKYNMLAGVKRDLYWRWNVHAGIGLTFNNKYHLLPAVMYMRQGVNNQMNTGLGFKTDFKESMSATFGLYSRFSTLRIGASADAVIPYIAFAISGFNIGINYDATVSQLKSAGSAVGAFELSLIYSGRGKNLIPQTPLVYPGF